MDNMEHAMEVKLFGGCRVSGLWLYRVEGLWVYFGVSRFKRLGFQGLWMLSLGEPMSSCSGFIGRRV